MRRVRLQCAIATLCGLGIAAGSAAAAPPATQPASLTFFGWADQHIKTDGSGEHCHASIDAMNTLPGTAYPPTIGGTVATPAFVFGCGDITEWPTHAAMRTYDRLVTRRLKFPAYDVMGNHDEGGKVPSQTIAKWLIARHGALSYTFARQGVHFIIVHSKYDANLGSPAQPITEEALTFIRAELGKLSAGAPAVVATHLCFDAITNRDAVVKAFGEANVILVLGGHYHKPVVHRYRGFHFVQLPSPKPVRGAPNAVTVIRIEPKRLVAVPYDCTRKAWVDDPRKILDVAIKGPSAAHLRAPTPTTRPARPAAAG